MGRIYEKGNSLSREKGAPSITNSNRAYFAKVLGCGYQEVIRARS